MNKPKLAVHFTDFPCGAKNKHRATAYRRHRSITFKVSERWEDVTCKSCIITSSFKDAVLQDTLNYTPA